MNVLLLRPPYVRRSYFTRFNLSEALTEIFVGPVLTGRHSVRVIDRKLKLVSTPAYMLGPHITDVARGIEALCREIVAMARTPAGVS